jgi:phenylalanyl-tRNA synthetase alpha chain
VESVEVLSSTGAALLAAAAATRLGIRAGQHNLLVRVVLRNLTRTLTRAEANELRDRVYLALHRGDERQLASPPANLVQ